MPDKEQERLVLKTILDRLEDKPTMDVHSAMWGASHALFELRALEKNADIDQGIDQGPIVWCEYCGRRHADIHINTYVGCDASPQGYRHNWISATSGNRTRAVGKISSRPLITLHGPSAVISGATISSCVIYDDDSNTQSDTDLPAIQSKGFCCTNCKLVFTDKEEFKNFYCNNGTIDHKIYCLVPVSSV